MQKLAREAVALIFGQLLIIKIKKGLGVAEIGLNRNWVYMTDAIVGENKVIRHLMWS
ncbi:MAG: hypothetical protein R2911_38765 [Caldilineaceae bacterium]